MPSVPAPALLVPFAEARDDVEAASVAMRDGVRLHTDVYLPPAVHAGERVPTVLVRAPYGVREDFMQLPALARYVTDRDMAMVVQDVRGKFRSAGVRIPFLHEVSDGHDTLDWITQQPWSDGSVGMYGESYYGFTQWAAAASAHAALRAMAPIVTGSCLPTWHVRPGVVPFYAAPVGWFAGCWNDASIFLQEEADILDFGRTPVLDVLVDGFDHARALVAELVLAPTSDLLARTYPGGLPAPRVSIPVLHRGGWWDNIKGSQLDDWQTVQTAPGSRVQFLEMAAMDHYSERFTLDDPAAGVEESVEEAVERVAASAVAFLAQHLGARRLEPRARVRVEVANAGWLEVDTWPPPAARAIAWWLDDAAHATAGADGGALRTGAVAATTTGAWRHDPADLVPSLARSDFHVLPVPLDESAVHARGDVATFTSDPLPVDLDILGTVELVLHVRSSCPELSLIAGLHHVRAGGATLITEGSRHAFVGGGWCPVTVDLGGVGYRVARGDRIRLSISTSRFPRYLPPSGTVGSDWLAAERRPFDIEIRTGDGARLIVPVLPEGTLA